MVVREFRNAYEQLFNGSGRLDRALTVRKNFSELCVILYNDMLVLAST